MSLDCKQERRWRSLQRRGWLHKNAQDPCIPEEWLAPAPARWYVQEGTVSFDLPVRRAGTLSCSIPKSLQKAKPLAGHGASATNGPATSQTLETPFRKHASAFQSITNSRDTGKLEEMVFHTKLKWKKSFLHFPSLLSALISTLKSFIDPW